ncbi:MAG: hypothetical protein GX593_02910 [Actinomycetales bacterium]|nr:hypothetical protein [Actinomycetales bacterium]
MRTTRLVAVGLVGLQALVLVGFAVAWLVSIARGTAVYPQAVVGLAVFALVAAALLALCARGVWRESAWTRAPVVTFQLLLGIMGVEWIRGDGVLLGVLAVLVAVVVVAAMLRPGVVASRRPIADD